MSEDKVMSRLEKVRAMLPDTKKLVVALAILGFMNSTPAQAQGYDRSSDKTEQVNNSTFQISGTYICHDHTDEVYLQANGEKVMVQSMKFAQAVKDVKNQTGCLGNIVVYFDANSSEVMGAKIGHYWVDFQHGFSKGRYEVGDHRDKVVEFGNSILDLNLTRIINNGLDIVERVKPGYASADPGSCVRVIGNRVVDGKVKQGWMPIHKRGADGYYIENGASNTNTNNTYSQSSSADTTTRYQGTRSSTSSQTPSVRYVQSNYR